ncbi:glycan-binding surface protein [Puia sp.]|jgi:hypothetical protein|uniref:glycan-binding surface protein n=1 Tax=Puia sp. TaxID=2045100 RepID=UPI002F3F67C1
MKRIIIFLLIIAGLVQFACKKNSSSGPPTVTDVRTVDPAKKDSTFTQAHPGTLIVIQGHNLDGLQTVYFNDTSAYFNPVYSTGTTIILSVPSYAQTIATKPNAPSTIRIVTNHGSTTYSFTLYLDPPAITSISLDITGTIATISGTNLAGIKKITFPVAGVDTPLTYKTDSAFQTITASIPAGTAFTDSLRVYCTYGVASFPYPPPMGISAASNENAIAGDTITLTGINFIGIKNVTFPGGIAATSFKTIDVNHLSAVVPSGITAPGAITINGTLGTSSSPQPFDNYLTPASPGYLSTFENQWPQVTDNTGWVSWTAAGAATPSSTYPNSTGNMGVLVNAGAMAPNTPPVSQGNPSALQLNDVPWVASPSTSVNGYSLKFEMYVAAPWKAGALWIMLGDWYVWKYYLARVAPWEKATGGVYQPSGWVTVTVPLNQFINPSTGTGTVLINGKVKNAKDDANEWDYQSFPTSGTPPSLFSDFGSTALCFSLANDQSTGTVPANGLNLAIDNVRIVKGQ